LSAELKCKFYGYDWNEWGERYTCQALLTDINEQDFTVLTEMVGNHLEGKTNDDVEAVEISDQFTKHLPEGLVQIFPKMDQLYVFRSSLEFIDRPVFEDLKQLKTISLSRNHLKVIPFDTFEDLVNVEYFSLSFNHLETLPNLSTMSKLKELYIFENKIKHFKAEFIVSNPNVWKVWAYNNELNFIDSAAFDNLANQTNIEVNLQNNKCINGKYDSFVTLKNDILNKC